MFDKEGHGFIPVPDLTEVPSLLDFRLNIDFKAVLGERTVRSHSDIPQALFEYHAIPQVLQKLGEKLSSDECQVLNAVKFQKKVSSWRRWPQVAPYVLPFFYCCQYIRLFSKEQ